MRRKKQDNPRGPARSTELALSPGNFNISLISGNDFSSLEQAQMATLDFLPDLIAMAIRRGLETGIFQIIDNRVVVCDTIGKVEGT